MSVYIPGMAAPSCCGLCPFQASRWTGDFCTAGQFMMPADFDFHEIHEKCPLVPIKTPHGRLVDADKLLKKGMPMSWSSQVWVQEVDVVTAPTIIEAEGGGGDG